MKSMIRILTLLISIAMALATQDLLRGEIQSTDGQYPLPRKERTCQHDPLAPASYRFSGTHTATGGVDTAWVRHYGSGLSSLEDAATAVAVDPSGSILVVGISVGLGTSVDYATVKYCSGGDSMWVRRYNGARNSEDHATALAVDDGGNVYVTGWSDGMGTGRDYATIKYNSAGDVLWVRRYDGPANSNDGAAALAVDDSGNVYVTGTADYVITQYGTQGGDYATIKYDIVGNTVWVRRYNGPGNGRDGATAIAVDDSGYVYVTGGSEGDYATFRYNSAGDTVWVRRYNGPDNQDDRASALAIDGRGNVWVTGNSDRYYGGWHCQYATIKYGPSGETVWEKRCQRPPEWFVFGPCLAVDASGNAYVAGETVGLGASDDYLTIKYNPNGGIVWERRYIGPDEDEYALVIAVDTIGNVYITGWSDGMGTGRDYATVKYSSAGDEVWVRRYNGARNGEDHAAALAVDNGGNVYVTGGSESDFATVKDGVAGDTVWLRRYAGPARSNDNVRSLAVDASGSVYVTGGSETAATNDDFATIKYSPTGEILWFRRYNGPGNDSDAATALTVDASGNVYITGWSSGSGTDYDYATIKYDAGGDTVWVRRFNGPEDHQDVAACLAVDDGGNVYVAGSYDGRPAGWWSPPIPAMVP